MKQVKHIVYLMLENRSFDHLLGWLYENDEPTHILPSGSTKRFNGLQPTMYNTDGEGRKKYVSKITPSMGSQIPHVDPNEEIDHVQLQMKNKMNGFFIRTFKKPRHSMLMRLCSVIPQNHYR